MELDDRPGTRRRGAGLVTGLAVLMLATGCGIPRDPDNTLRHVDQTHELVVGVAPAPPQVEVRNGVPAGPEAQLAAEFAASRGAKVTWVVAGQEELVKQLEDGQVDMVVGGLTKDAPITDSVALTRPYAQEVDDHGDVVKRVVAVPLGENAMVSALERWFDGRQG